MSFILTLTTDKESRSDHLLLVPGSAEHHRNVNFIPPPDVLGFELIKIAIIAEFYSVFYSDMFR